MTENSPGFGLIYEGRLVCFYSYECDWGMDGKIRMSTKIQKPFRLKALQMGADILQFVFTGK